MFLIPSRSKDSTQLFLEVISEHLEFFWPFSFLPNSPRKQVCNFLIFKKNLSKPFVGLALQLLILLGHCKRSPVVFQPGSVASGNDRHGLMIFVEGKLSANWQSRPEYKGIPLLHVSVNMNSLKIFYTLLWWPNGENPSSVRVAVFTEILWFPNQCWWLHGAQVCTRWELSPLLCGLDGNLYSYCNSSFWSWKRASPELWK